MKEKFLHHNKVKFQILLFLLFSLNSLILSHPAFGATLNLTATWTPNTDADMKEYRLYRTDVSRTLIGTTSHPGTSYGPFPVTVSDGSSGTLTFVLTAVDTSNLESADSSPSSYTYDLRTTSVTIAATDNTATEAGTTTGTFTVSRTGSTSSALTVNYAVSGTATSGSDYNVLSGSVSIAAGSSTGTITVTPINDSTVESNETVIVTISANAAYTVGSPSSATVTITSDDSALPTVTIAATDSTATEAGTTTGTFTVSRTGSTSSGLTVNYAVSGTATSGSDYNVLSGSVSIAAGSSTGTITVTPINDSTVESNETVIVTISANAAYTVGSPSSATVTITSDDSGLPTVTVTATDNTATEAGTTTGTFTVSRTGSTSSALTVNYAVSGTATSGSDYNALSGSVTIAAGSSTGTITVTPINDSTVESNETVIVTISANAAYTVGSPSNATVTITSDDSALPTVTITATDNTATEAGTTTGTFTVSRTGSTSSGLTVNYAVSGTATSGSDYNALSGSVTIAAGSSTGTITVTPINDSTVESNETVIVTISANAAYTVGSPSSATVTITSDDSALPTVTIAATDSTATEAGTTTGTFTVSRTGSTSSALTVNYAVSGTATSGSDYNALSGSVTIAAGSSTGTITVTPINDSTVESNETVIVTISANAAYTVGSPSSATVTITSDDSGLPTVTVTATDNTATEAGTTTGTFTVSRTGSTSSALTVNYAVSGTATSGSDYNALSGSVTIAAGSSTGTITVTPINDSTVESNETVIVTISANAAYTVGSPSNATVTITSDDSGLPTVTVTATDNTATEAGTTTGTFTVSRTGSTSSALTVNYAVSGTATSGSDYNALSGSVSIPAGSSTATITVTPINDSSVESNETVIVTISANAAYTVGSPSNGTVTIVSDELAQTDTVTSDPPGLQIEVDKVTYTAPQSFAWAPGSSHTLSAVSPQNGAGAKYMFASWSDRKSKTHTIRAPSSNSTYTAKFTTKHSLTTSINLPGSGTVSPSGAFWYNSGKNISVKATPVFGYEFSGWSGDYSGSTNPIELTMDGAKNVVANFSVSIPPPPKGKSIGYTDISYAFSTKRPPNHSLQYQYDWGDGSPSVWGHPKQSHTWPIPGTYQIRVMARSTKNTSFVSTWSNITSVTIKPNPLIHVTSPMKGETWVEGTTHTIAWDSKYLSQAGTLYLFYWYVGKWHPITTLSPTVSSYDWTIPNINEPLTSPPKPKGNIQSIRVWIGNWVVGENGKGRWECWDTNDPSFRILDDGWLYTISKGDTGGATLWFDEAGFDGYGVSFELGAFRIRGNYDIDTKGLITGTYGLSDFESEPPAWGSGNITGSVKSNATKMTMVLKDLSELPVFKMVGKRILSEPDIPQEWSATISGDVTGSLDSLTIGLYKDLSSGENYSHVFQVSWSGMIGSGFVSIQGNFFFTPVTYHSDGKVIGNIVYGVYEMTGGINETGVISGTLNPNKGKFTLNLTGDNGNKYRLVGQEVTP